jgi:Ca2+-transporting ATPase
MLNSNRRLNNKFNIFAGLGRNWFFIAISLIMIGTQILFVFIGGRAFSITRLDGVQWSISVLLGLLSIPVGVIIRLIPDRLFSRRIWGLRGIRPAFACCGRRRAVDV